MVDADIDPAEKLRVWLMETWQEPEIMSRDVVQSGPNCVRDSKAAKRAPQIFETHGWLVALLKGTVIRGSARSQAWRAGVTGPAHFVANVAWDGGRISKEPGPTRWVVLTQLGR